MEDLSIQELLDFSEIFSGNRSGYGVHIYNDNKEESSKEQGTSYTEIKPLTEEQYRLHLEGKRGLGVSPITEKNLCRFTVIDIDIYNPEIIKSYVDSVYRSNLPILPFRSKSGGLHLYVFFDDFIKTKEAVDFTRKFMTILAVPRNTELFPKQLTLVDKSIGNWVNLPYFNLAESKTGLLNEDMKIIPLSEAALIIRNRRVSITNEKYYFDSLPLSDAPPCLQAIYIRGDTAFRNEYLFSLGRYLKTKFGDEYEQEITKANNDLKHPITLSELMSSVVSSLRKKDYSYKCKSEPLCSLCDKELCKTRKFGIGKDEVSELNYEQLVQYTSQPPYYEWTINGKVLRFFDESDLINQSKFQKICFRELHKVPNMIKEAKWKKILNTALDNIVVQSVDEADDMSPGAMLKRHISKFVEDRVAKDIQLLRFGKVYLCEKEKVYYFKGPNLIHYITVEQSFKVYSSTEIQVVLKEMGGEPITYLKGVGPERLWRIPVKSIASFISEKAIDTFKVNFLASDEVEEPY